MASALLVYQARNHLRYLLNFDDTASLEIKAVGGATPDLLTDAVGDSPIKAIMNVKAAGYGIIPAGGLTTDAQANALLMSVNAGVNVGLRPTTLIARLTERSAPSFVGLRAARGSTDTGTPSYYIDQINSVHASFTCYLDIEVPGAIGQ